MADVWSLTVNDWRLPPAPLNELQVLAQAELAIFVADAFGGLEGEYPADAAGSHDLGLGCQTAGQRVRRLGDVVEGGHAPAQHRDQVEIGGRADHLAVQAVFDERPPEVLQERPEPGRRVV